MGASFSATNDLRTINVHDVTNIEYCGSTPNGESYCHAFRLHVDDDYDIQVNLFSESEDPACLLSPSVRLMGASR